MQSQTRNEQSPNAAPCPCFAVCPQVLSHTDRSPRSSATTSSNRKENTPEQCKCHRGGGSFVQRERWPAGTRLEHAANREHSHAGLLLTFAAHKHQQTFCSSLSTLKTLPFICSPAHISLHCFAAKLNSSNSHLSPPRNFPPPVTTAPDADLHPQKVPCKTQR